MSLRDYQMRPDEGLFENIERRLLRRRWLRRGGMLLGVAVVVAGAVWLLHSPSAPEAVTPQPEAVTVAAAPEVEMPQQDLPTAAVSQEQPVASHTPAAAVPPAGQTVAKVRENEPAATVATTVAAPAPAVAAPREMPAARPSAPVAEPVVADQPVAETETEASDIAAPVKSGSTAPSGTHYENLMYAPNVIVPSDEDDRNRIFKLSTSSAVSDFHLYIFNRGGRQVFSSADINRAWDATHDGTPLPQGTYVWVARFRDSSGNLREEKGTVTVLR